MKKVNDAVFIKPSRLPDELNTLTFNRIIHNHKNNIVTALIPDTNILINMEKVIREKHCDETLEKYGLLNMVNFINEVDRYGLNVTWSPYFSILEMPGKYALKSLDRLKVFDKKYWGTRVTDEELKPDNFDSNQQTKNYPCWSDSEQYTHAVTFCSLLLIQIIERDMREASPLEKMRVYLNLVEHKIGPISGKEFNIALLIFSPISDTDREFNDIRQNIVMNFCESSNTNERYYSPPTSETMISIASNGARDIGLLNACNILDSDKQEDIDAWIVTQDFKLAKFCDNFYNVGRRKEAGEAMLMRDFSYVNEFISKSVNEMHTRTVFRRSLIDHIPKDLSRVVRTAYELIDIAASGLNSINIPKKGLCPFTFLK